MKKEGRNGEPDEVEDWCFVCKEGGDLRICDYQGCTKVYHFDCVNKKESFLESKRRWFCDHHSCSSCLSRRKKISFPCLMCTYSLCYGCRKSNDGSDEFAVVRGREDSGLCADCLELMNHAEDNAEYDRNGDKLDFNDPETFETGFKECWDILKEKEGFTREMIDDEDVITLTERLIRKQKSDHVTPLGSDEKVDEVVSPTPSRDTKEEGMSDDDDDEEILLKDLALHKRKKRKLVILDEDEDEDGITLKDQDQAAPLHKKPKLVISSDPKYYSRKKIEEKDFASVVASNIKLVYLRRSLVEELMSKQPEDWERKVVGSYVRVENDPEDSFQGHSSYQLTQIKGITRKQEGEEILLQLLTRDVPIFLLSDCDFTEEECGDLRERAEKCWLRRPTVVEIKHKARELQEDIVKDWTERQFNRLMNCVRPKKNQHGWIGKELCNYMELREMLRQISEQGRLLQQEPQVIAEVLDLSDF